MEGIVKQEQCHDRAVRELNERLKEGGSKFEFPIGEEFPVGAEQGLSEKSRYNTVQQKRFLYLDGEYVRGGYILIGHGALLDGHLSQLEFLKLPLSEGSVDLRYSIFGALLLKDALGKAPMMYGLGGGGMENPAMKMMKRMGFRLHPVPFWFRVLNASNFLRNIEPLRTTPFRRIALDTLSYVPLARSALTLYQASKARAGLLTRETSIETAPRFGTWADKLWEECGGSYSFIAVRDAATLNWRLPPEDKRLRRIKLIRDGQLRGWVVVTDSQFAGHRQFGSMRVGAIVDALCLPSEECATMAAAVGYLQKRGVDLIVSNQCAATWNAALGHTGFLEAASNFVFAASPQLTALISRNDPNFERVQMNRCDGDGPIHL